MSYFWELSWLCFRGAVIDPVTSEIDGADDAADVTDNDEGKRLAVVKQDDHQHGDKMGI